MRKGADCLSKWVGEAEKQLRLLFEQARAYQPSVIFFDEIDGLTPVRSSKQDQIHSSIVSTLLALMDGLDSRGQVVVIGATNRVDAIDPALRRPGRFDRELLFDLPDVAAREAILAIHTRAWRPPLDHALRTQLAERTNGYAGADLKALCTEAALHALQRTYPQIYGSAQKLRIDAAAVRVQPCDFEAALARITPCSYRSNPVNAQPLPAHLRPLLLPRLRDAVRAVYAIFPFFTDQNHLLDRAPRLAATQPIVSFPLFLLSAASLPLLDSLARAVLHSLDGCHLVQFSLLSSLKEGTFVETLLAAVHEAFTHTPSILFIPQVQAWQAVAPDLIPLLVHTIRSLSPECPLLLMLTSTEDLTQNDAFAPLLAPPAAVRHLHVEDKNWDNRAFLEQLVPVILKENIPTPPTALPQLEVVQEEPKKVVLTAEEKELLVEKENHYLRELRDFCREVLYQLSRNSRYRCFNEPVKEEEVPDYYDIISHPMCFDIMFAKLDNGEYTTLEPFLSDIRLIQANAREYNPSTSSGKRIVRAAASMVDEVEEDVHRLKKRGGRELLLRCEEIARRRAEESEQPANELTQTLAVEEEEVKEVKEEEKVTEAMEEVEEEEKEEKEEDPKAEAEAMGVVESLIKSCPCAQYDELIALYARVVKECLLMDERQMKKEEKLQELRRVFHEYSVCATNTPLGLGSEQLLRRFFTRSRQLVQDLFSAQLHYALPQNLRLHVALLQAQHHLVQLVRAGVTLVLQLLLLGPRVAQIHLQPHHIILGGIELTLHSRHLLLHLYSSCLDPHPTLLLLLHRVQFSLQLLHSLLLLLPLLSLYSSYSHPSHTTVPFLLLLFGRSFTSTCHHSTLCFFQRLLQCCYSCLAFRHLLLQFLLLQHCIIHLHLQLLNFLLFLLQLVRHIHAFLLLLTHSQLLHASS